MSKAAAGLTKAAQHAIQLQSPWLDVRLPVYTTAPLPSPAPPQHTPYTCLLLLPDTNLVEVCCCQLPGLCGKVDVVAVMDL